MLGTMVDRLCDWRTAHPDVTVADVHFDRFVTDPLATVADVYDTFGLEFTNEARAAMAAHLAANPQGKHGTHRYSLADCGIDPAAVTERFRRYVDQFGVARSSVTTEGRP